jgi:hypothetical protein
VSDSADPRDAAQDLAERVAGKLATLGEYEGGLAWARRKSASKRRKEMVSLIATELRAGGWVKGRAGTVSTEELMSGIQ